MPNQSGKIVLVLVLFLLLLGAAAYFFLPILKKQQYTDQEIAYSPGPVMDYKEANDSKIEMKDYYSKNFKMHITTPANFQGEDNFPIFILKDGENKIEVIRNGTNFKNLNEYLQDFDVKKKVKEISREEKVINTYPVIEREVSYGDKEAKQKSTYLYIANYVYIFSTSEESLYPVLDQIVQSFEYKP